MLTRVALSVVVGIITGLVAWLIGTACVATTIPIVTAIGAFLVTAAAVIGLLGGLYHFVRGGSVLQG